MHLFGSHTFSMINAANERIWLNSISARGRDRNLTDAEAEALLPGTAKATAATF